MIDPTLIEKCPDCHSKADTCVLCLVCIRCAPDGHDEGCSNEGDEYDAETTRYIEQINTDFLYPKQEGAADASNAHDHQ